MQAEMEEGEPNEVQNALLAELKTCHNYEGVFARWESSSRMRTWFTEKKKSWSNKIKEEEEKPIN